MMEPAEDIELLELLFVDLGPLQEGFAGVLIRVYRCGAPVRPAEAPRARVRALPTTCRSQRVISH